MTRRERFLKALRMEKPDRVPLYVEDIHGVERFLKSSDESIHDILEIDNKCFWALPPIDEDDPLYQKWVEKLKLRGEEKLYSIDSYGRLFKDGNYHGSIIESIDDLREFYLPKNDNIKDILKNNITEYKRKEIALVGNVAGFLDVPYTAAGMENYFLWVYDYPDDINIYLDKWEVYNLEQIEMFKEIGFDVIMVGEDMGNQKSLMISQEFLSKNIFPRLKKLAYKACDLGLPIILHSCGNINKILPEIADLKFNAINPLQPAASMNLADFKKKYGKKMCPIGNLDVQGVLTFGKPEEVREAVKDCINAAAYDGGYIFSPSHAIMENMPVENVLAMRDALIKYGKYSFYKTHRGEYPVKDLKQKNSPVARTKEKDT